MSFSAEVLSQLIPTRKSFSITPDDSNDLRIPAFLYVSGGGSVKVDTAGGDTVTFHNLPTGKLLPVRIKKVYSTDTTATSLMGIELKVKHGH